MKHEKIKKVLAIIAVVLFSLSIVLGIVFSILPAKMDNSAYAGELDIMPVDLSNTYWDRYDGEYVQAYSSLITINDDIIDSGVLMSGYNTGGRYIYFKFPFLSHDLLCCEFYYRQDDTGISFGYTVFDYIENDFNEMDIYVEGYRVADISYLEIMVFNGEIPVSLLYWANSHGKIVYLDDVQSDGYDNGYNDGINDGYSDGYTDGYNAGFLDGHGDGEAYGYDKGYNDGISDGYDEGLSDGYSDGYDEGLSDGYNDGYSDGQFDGGHSGYNEGYSDGYSNGYSNGLNKGHSDNVTDPISSFLNPVHEFLNINLFGTISVGSIFNVVLFVAVALIFIKMFSGG